LTTLVKEVIEPRVVGALSLAFESYKIPSEQQKLDKIRFISDSDWTSFSKLQQGLIVQHGFKTDDFHSSDIQSWSLF